MKTILVTGSSGFLGSVVVTKALSEGYYVVGIDKKSSTLKPQREFSFLETDINKLDFKLIPKYERKNKRILFFNSLTFQIKKVF